MITSLQNPLVKQIRKLHHRKGRRLQDRFLLEGTHLIETAIEGNFVVETICYTNLWQQKYLNLWQKLQNKGIRLELVSPEVLKSLATTVNPDGIIATVTRFTPSLPPMERIKLGLMIDTLQDPGNLGTIMRTAAATGVESLWLSSNSVEIDNPKVLRASAGAWFKVPCHTGDNLSEIIQMAQNAGIEVIATLPDAKTIYWELDLSQPILILLGNEGAGLGQGLIELANQQVSIPQAEGVESLNVAIAASVLLYEVTRQRGGVSGHNQS